MEPLCLTIAEFCFLVGVKRTTAYALIKKGRVDVVKLGRRTLITRASIEALIERSLVERSV